MIKKSGNQLVIVVAFFCILLITACTSQLKDVGTITPIRHSPSIPRFLTIPDNYASIEFEFLNFYKGELKPLPFRLVVKIDASEVLYIYRPTPKDYSSLHESMPFLSELPDSIKVTNTMELGNAKSGERLVRLKLERPMQYAVIQQAFNDSSFKLYKSSSVEVRDRDKVYEIDIIVPRNANRGIDYHYKQSAYPQLKPDSKLHDTLNSLGVHSIRRVFRRTESQDGEGHIRVTTLKSHAKNAKQKNPVRAARGYTNLAVPENMENWFVLSFRSDANIDRAFTLLQNEGGIQNVSYDYPALTHQEPHQEPEFSNQWALQSTDSNGIGIMNAWSISSDNDPVVVAVIDKGIKADLDEFQGRMWENLGEIPENGIDDDVNGVVDDRHGITVDDFELLPYPIVAGTHGTHVAGIISAESTLGNLIAGVAGKADVRLMNISLGHHVICTDVAEALEYACGNPETDVVNMSLGTAPTHPLWEAVQYCLSEDVGVSLVASAGNSRLRVTENYFTTNAVFPAFYPGVISVGGSQNDGQIWIDDQDNTRGSNYGIGLDLVAPAENIHTITFSTSGQTQAELKTDFSGTSSSAAFVSGVAAVILGKHDTVRLEKLRHWLRTTAKDIQDPIGTIAAGVEPTGMYTGDDIYTGAGLLNAGQAVTTDTPDPIVVDIFIEKTGVLENAVIGSPDLGIVVEGPISGSWELHYAEGDWPDSPDDWIRLDVPPDVSSQTLTVARTEDFWFVDVEPGYNYLHTDNLINRQIYTLRLKASDIHGNAYYSYDAFMPLRAMLYKPAQGTPVPVDWGWPELVGIVDSRPGAMYDIALIDMVSGADVGPARPWYTFDISESNLGAKSKFLLAPEPYESRVVENVPIHMGIRPNIYNHDLRWYLTVISPDGTDTIDTQDIYVDGTSFPSQPGNWPRDIPKASDPLPGGNVQYYFRGVHATDVTGNGTHRIFVYKGGYLICLEPDGSLVWQKEMFPRPSTLSDILQAPRFVVADLNGDGPKEIVVAGVTRGPSGSWFRDSIQVLDVNGNDLINWPWQINYVPGDIIGCGSTEVLGSVRVADIDGLPNGHKEIVFYQLHPGTETVSIHALDLNGQELPNYPITLNQRYAYLYTADIDGDAKDEIIVQPGYLAFDDTGAIASWSPQNIPNGNISIGQADSDGPFEVLVHGRNPITNKYFASVVEGDGTLAQGWPISLEEAVPRFNAHCQCTFFSPIFGKFTDSISDTGDRKVVLVYDKIKIFNIDGTLDSGFPVIDLGGEARGFDLIDVNDDGTPELVVLVLVYVDDMGWRDSGYYNLEAYTLDGTALSSTDSRWPIRVPSGHSQALHNSLIIQNVDNDSHLEAIRVMNMHPYGQYSQILYGSYGNRAGRIEVLELRD